MLLGYLTGLDFFEPHGARGEIDSGNQGSSSSNEGFKARPWVKLKLVPSSLGSISVGLSVHMCSTHTYLAQCGGGGSGVVVVQVVFACMRARVCLCFPLACIGNIDG